jgi:hypothetical protein
MRESSRRVTLDESKMEPHIVAIGGGGFSAGPENLLLENYVLSLVDKPRPKVCFVPTASGDSEQYLLKFYAAFARLPAIANHLPLFRLAVSDAYEVSRDGVGFHEKVIQPILLESSGMRSEPGGSPTSSISAFLDDGDPTMP